MKIVNIWAKNFSGIAVFVLISGPALAETDNACKGEKCASAKPAKVLASPESTKPSKDAAAVKLVPAGDGSVRKNNTAQKVAPTADGSVRKAMTAGDGSAHK